MDRCGFLRITYEQLHRLLGLKEDVEIYDVSVDERAYRSNTFVVKLAHPTFSKSQEGYELPCYPLTDIKEEN